MKKVETDLAVDILSDKITNLLGEYSTIEEDSIQGEKLQEKIETLVGVQEQVLNGNEVLTQKVIEKKSQGIL